MTLPTYPHLTTAVIVQREDRVLMVNEEDNGINVWNQPAGHIETGESIQAAALRETLEETRYAVELTHLVGLYQSRNPVDGIHYVRLCFAAKLLNLVENAVLDADIRRVSWLPIESLLADEYPVRSPLVKQSLADYQAGSRYPLDLIKPLSTSLELQ